MADREPEGARKLAKLRPFSIGHLDRVANSRGRYRISLPRPDIARRGVREADRTITDFADYERPKHLAAARRVANAEQRAALRRMPAKERRP
jgi:hypothetical protein